MKTGYTLGIIGDPNDWNNWPIAQAWSETLNEAIEIAEPWVDRGYYAVLYREEIEGSQDQGGIDDRSE